MEFYSIDLFAMSEEIDNSEKLFPEEANNAKLMVLHKENSKAVIAANHVSFINGNSKTSQRYWPTSWVTVEIIN